MTEPEALGRKLTACFLAVTWLLLCTPAFSRVPVWNMAIGDGGGSAQEALGLYFARLVKERSNDAVEIRLFVNGQLGNEQATIVDASLGAMDLAVVASNNLAAFSPSVGLLALPYLFSSIDEAARFVGSSFEQDMIGDARRDVRVRILAWTFSGFRTLTNSSHPVATLDDLQGLVVRVPRNAIMIETYRAWGINPTPMAWSETFTALQQRVVDGQDSPLIAIHSMKFAEVQPYFTELHYMFLLEPLIMSEAVFSELEPDMQALVLEAGRDATAFSVAWLTEQESRIRGQLIEEYGVTIGPLEDEAAWKKLAREQVWPQFYDAVGGRARVEALLRSLQAPGD